MLGSPDARRLSIVSLRISHGGRYLHHNYVVAVLNDLFGIQARGGCSCAGPYGHRLLAIGDARSHAFREEISLGCEGIKPGWTRINFNYFISGTVADYLTDAISLIADHGHRLLTDYRFDPRTGLWRHHAGITRPPLRLADLRYAPDGTLTCPARRASVSEDALGRLPAPGAQPAGQPPRPDRRRPDRPARRLRGAALVPPAPSLPDQRRYHAAGA